MNIILLLPLNFEMIIYCKNVEQTRLFKLFAINSEIYTIDILYRATKYKTTIVTLYLRDLFNLLAITYIYNSKPENEDKKDNSYNNDYKKDNEELKYQQKKKRIIRKGKKLKRLIKSKNKPKIKVYKANLALILYKTILPLKNNKYKENELYNSFIYEEDTKSVI